MACAAGEEEAGFKSLWNVAAGAFVVGVGPGGGKGSLPPMHGDGCYGEGLCIGVMVAGVEWELARKSWELKKMLLLLLLHIKVGFKKRPD